MSDENEETPAATEAPAAKVAKKRPAVRKSSKPAAKASEEATPEAAAESAPAPRAEEAPATPQGPSDSAADSSDGGRIAFLVETPAPEPAGGSKKRRRRKKKHGQGQPGQSQHPHAVSVPSEATGHAPSVTPAAEAAHAPAMHAAPRPKLDPEQVAKKAWKIFQSEVGEEGLALIDDHDAREISRRCFRLAEIFLEEAARRSQR